MTRLRFQTILLVLPLVALIGSPPGAAFSKLSAVQGESLKALKATIDKEGNKTPRKVFEQLGKMKSAEAFRVLEAAASTLKGMQAQINALSAMRHMLDQDRLSEQVLDHVGAIALESNGTDAMAATRALTQFGPPGKQLLRGLITEAKAANVRQFAFKPIHEQLLEEGGTDVRDLVLENFVDPRSGSEARALELLHLSQSKADAKVFAQYVKGDEFPISMRRIVVRAMEAFAPSESKNARGRPKKPDPAEAVLLAALRSDEPRLEFQGLVSASARSAPISEVTLRTVKKLAKADDDATRRAATLLVLEQGEGKLDPFDLAESRDAMMRQAGAITLGKRPGDPSFKALAKLVADRDWSVRVEAIRALTKLRDRRAIGLLVERVNREEGRLIADVATALEQLTGRDYGNSPKTWRRFWNNEGDDFEMPSREEATKALATRATRREANSAKGASASFYGLAVISERFAVVFDASLSMNAKGKSGKRRIDTAKEQLAGMIGRLQEGTRFNLVPFAARVEPLWDEITPLNEDTKAESLTFTEGLKMKLGTDIYDGLFTAFQDEQVDTIYVLSDGASTEGVVKDPDGLREEVARWNTVRGITIHCV